MKPGHFLFETLLIIITMMFGFRFFINSSNGLDFMAWLALLGILQVAHAFAITLLYRRHPLIFKAILIYWLIVGFEFILMYCSMRLAYSGLLGAFALPGLPVALALFLWWITWHFKERWQQRIEK
jgi:hypothetical protein